MATALAAFTAVPRSFTFPLSQAAAAWVRVLNILIAQRYLSRRIFSALMGAKLRKMSYPTLNMSGSQPLQTKRIGYFCFTVSPCKNTLFMKKIKIFYWIVTGLMAALLGLGAFFDAISAPEAVASVTKLGYPAYIIPFL